MMQALLKNAYSENILILNQQTVTISRRQCCRNCFGDFLLVLKKYCLLPMDLQMNWQGAVKPARAQVLITEPIDNLDVRGTFHLDCGYYYFRNIGSSC
jgi:hypothetical protein